MKDYIVNIVTLVLMVLVCGLALIGLSTIIARIIDSEPCGLTRVVDNVCVDGKYRIVQ